MKLPVKAISYSQLYSYFNRPDEWYKRYVLKEPFIPTPAMKYGTICHEAFQNPTYDWHAALKDEGFLSDKERMLGEFLAYLEKYYEKIERPVKAENSDFVDVLGKTIMAKYDGDDPGLITEYKTGAKLWTEDRVHESFQLTWYSFIKYLKVKKIPKLVLHTFSSANGKAASYSIKRTKEHFKHIPHIVNLYVDGVEKDIFSQADFTPEMMKAVAVVN